MDDRGGADHGLAGQARQLTEELAVLAGTVEQYRRAAGSGSAAEVQAATERVGRSLMAFDRHYNDFLQQYGQVMVDGPGRYRREEQTPDDPLANWEEQIQEPYRDVLDRLVAAEETADTGVMTAYREQTGTVPAKLRAYGGVAPDVAADRATVVELEEALGAVE